MNSGCGEMSPVDIVVSAEGEVECNCSFPQVASGAATLMKLELLILEKST